MVDLPAWVRKIYDQSWPDHLMDKDKWRGWHEDAARGRPPSIAEVAVEQYGRRAPWYLREGLWARFEEIGTESTKMKCMVEQSRDTGKTVGTSLAYLWVGEYLGPYIEKMANGRKVYDENRRLNIAGRSFEHVGDENLDMMKQLLSRDAPWLKLPENPDTWEDPDKVKERRIRKRKFNMRRMDLASGVRIQGYGWDQSQRGPHPIVASADDLVTEENWQQADSQKEVVTDAMSYTLLPGGLLLVTGTPQAPGDLYDLLAELDSFDYEVYPAYDPDGSRGYKEKNKQDIQDGWMPESMITREEDWHCLTPLFAPFEQLESEREGSREDEISFQTERMCRRIDEERSLVDMNSFHECLNLNLTYQQSTPNNHPYPTHCGVDPSMLKDSDMGFVVVDKRENDKRRVLAAETIDADVEDNPLLVLQKINELHDRYHCRFLVESNAFQAIIQPLMGRLRPAINIDGFSLKQIKHEAGGWELVGRLVKSHLLELPYGATSTEKDLLEEGVIDKPNLNARQTTSRIEEQCAALMKNQGEIVEDRSTKTDLFSALYLALKSSQDPTKQTSVQGGDMRKTLLTPDDEPVQANHPEAPQHLRGDKKKNIPSTESRLSRASRLDNR